MEVNPAHGKPPAGVTEDAQPWNWESDRAAFEPAAPRPGEIEALIGQLEQHGARHPVFDYHGNAIGPVLRLMVLRFHTTHAICDAIDRWDTDPARQKVVEALYRVLGFVKDPDSIPWLERKLLSQRESLHDRYFWLWHTGIGIGFGNDPGYGDSPWLEGRERWIRLFVKAHASEPSTDRRIQLMVVLKGFDDPSAVAFFRAQREAAKSAGEILLTEAYLHQHGVAVDEARISTAIAALAPDAENHSLLVGAADALRHEAFVPYLIDTLGRSEPDVYPTQHPGADALKKVTFVLDIEDEAGWRAWYAEHQGERRQVWVDGALTAFRQQMRNDPEAALKQFDRAIYHWNDIAALPLIRDDLLPLEMFHSRIAGWLNLTYTRFHRSKFEPIAEKLAKHREKLEDWARRLLTERGFLPEPGPEAWADYVRYSNRRM